VKLPACHACSEARSVDPIAVHPGAMARTQVLLVMGDEGAKGRLVVNRAKDGADNACEGHVKAWCGKARATTRPLRAEHALFVEEDRAAGFDGGRYIPNPLWKIQPDAASTVMSGNLPSERGAVQLAQQ
jgi:hypothetical protein